MEIRQLTYLVVTSRVGSFSKAAKELGIAQPSLSEAIAQLESELEIQIFERSSRGVSLTEIGQHVLIHARAIVQEVEQVRLISRGVRSRIRFGVAPVLAWLEAPRIMRKFAVSHPSVEISVAEHNVPDIVSLILQGKLDVGMVATVSSMALREQNNGHISVERLFDVEQVALLPRKFKNSANPIPLAVMKDEVLAIPKSNARTQSLRSGILKAFELEGLPTPRLHDVPSVFEAIPLVMAGLATAIVPEGIVKSFGTAELVARRIENGPRALEVSLLRRSANDSAVIREFISSAKMNVGASQLDD